MIVIIVLLMLLIGMLLDMLSTYWMVGLQGEKFREVNQNFIPGDADFFIINAIFFVILSSIAAFSLTELSSVKRYVQETNLLLYFKDIFSLKLNRENVFVSTKTVYLVSALVTIGSIGTARFLAFCNNMIEYFGGTGFMRTFMSVFSVNEQIAVTIVFSLSVILMFPVTYIILRSAVR